jgi:hypothetical protein
VSKESENQPLSLTLERVAQVARETALRDGGHAPMVIAEGSVNATAVEIGALGDSHEIRMAQMRVAGYVLGRQANIGKLLQVFFISEGWMSVASKGRLPATKPSEDPNRVEILLINHILLETNATQIVAYEMIRANDDKLVGLRKLPDMEREGGQAQNFLLNAFIDEYKREHQIRNN